MKGFWFDGFSGTPYPFCIYVDTNIQAYSSIYTKLIVNSSIICALAMTLCCAKKPFEGCYFKVSRLLTEGSTMYIHSPSSYNIPVVHPFWISLSRQ